MSWAMYKYFATPSSQGKAGPTEEEEEKEEEDVEQNRTAGEQALWEDAENGESWEVVSNMSTASSAFSLVSSASTTSSSFSLISSSDVTMPTGGPSPSQAQQQQSQRQDRGNTNNHPSPTTTPAIATTTTTTSAAAAVGKLIGKSATVAAAAAINSRGPSTTMNLHRTFAHLFSPPPFPSLPAVAHLLPGRNKTRNQQQQQLQSHRQQQQQHGESSRPNRSSSSSSSGSSSSNSSCSRSSSSSRRTGRMEGEEEYDKEDEEDEEWKEEGGEYYAIRGGRGGFGGKYNAIRGGRGGFGGKYNAIRGGRGGKRGGGILRETSSSSGLTTRPHLQAKSMPLNYCQQQRGGKLIKAKPMQCQCRWMPRREENRGEKRGLSHDGENDGENEYENDDWATTIEHPTEPSCNNVFRNFSINKLTTTTAKKKKEKTDNRCSCPCVHCRRVGRFPYVTILHVAD